MRPASVPMCSGLCRAGLAACPGICGAAERKKYVRWAPFSAAETVRKNAVRALRDLKLDNETISRVKTLVTWADGNPAADEAEVRRMMEPHGAGGLRQSDGVKWLWAGNPRSGHHDPGTRRLFKLKRACCKGSGSDCCRGEAGQKRWAPYYMNCWSMCLRCRRIMRRETLLKLLVYLQR